MTARLQIALHGHKRLGGFRWTSSRYLSLLSVYAPTVKAPSNVKAKFVGDHQHILDTLPAGDVVGCN